MRCVIWKEVVDLIKEGRGGGEAPLEQEHGYSLSDFRKGKERSCEGGRRPKTEDLWACSLSTERRTSQIKKGKERNIRPSLENERVARFAVLR